MLPEGKGDEAECGKRCRVCGEKINFAAQKCVHCDSWQNWQRYFIFSSSLLSLLVALVAVLTAAVPVLVQAFTPKNSDIVFSVQGVSAYGISVFVSNQGTRPATMSDAALLSLVGTGGDMGRREDIFIHAMGPPDEVVPAGSSLLARFFESSQTLSKPTGSYQCEFSLAGTNFDGTDYLETVPFDCGKLRAMWDPVSAKPARSSK